MMTVGGVEFVADTIYMFLIKPYLITIIWYWCRFGNNNIMNVIYCDTTS